MERTLKNYVGGSWVEAVGRETLPLVNPATGASLGRVPLSVREDVRRAVDAAQKAFPAWRETPVLERSRFMFRWKELMEKRFEDLARCVTIEHGKTLSESRGSVRRGIENLEVAAGMPSLMMGESLEDISRGIDCETIRQPLGVFAAIAPFNFPAMVPLWFLPYAITTGNTFIVKPSEQVPLSQELTFQILEEVGLPPGVVNLVHGGRDVVDALCTEQGIVGVSFVGSTPVAKHVYVTGTQAGKRVQALGGAKNFVVVMDDCDLARTVPILTESCYGCAGERCLAGSTVVAVGDVYGRLREALHEHARRIVVGDGLDDGVDMGPVVSRRHMDRVLGYIQKGIDEGAKLTLDGRNPKLPPGLEKGNFIGPCIFEDVTPEMTIAREEIFGPVMVLRRAKDLDEAISIIHASEYANATSIFTQSGKHAREFRYRAGVSMIGVNIGVAAPMSFFPFGGAKSSFFGDLKAHGKDSLRFYTDQKVVISRWF
ncbi:MAG: CoA-acylating methylmalonate-semialdehyde dehydrogenase [Deltaproteobacteria bacterium]|nr:CoA-acylating methylmalonate-semialdehyde dehydrogenase [Deltaproteobacteria bacterium]